MVATVYSRRPLHVRVPRTTTRLASLASRAAVFALLLLLMTLVARRVGLVAYGELALPLAVSAASAASAILIAVLALAECWLTGARGGWRAIRAMVLAALVAAPFAAGAILYLVHPTVSDVATDPLDPPPITAGGDAPAAAPGLATRRYDAAIERVGVSVRAALAEIGWRETGAVVVDAREDAVPVVPDGTPAVPVPRMRAPTEEQVAIIEELRRAEREALAAERREEEAVIVLSVEVRQPVLGLVSDVVVRLRDDGEQTSVDVRARSREGSHDLGRNAALARRFLAALDEVTARDGLR